MTATTKRPISLVQKLRRACIVRTGDEHNAPATPVGANGWEISYLSTAALSCEATHPVFGGDDFLLDARRLFEKLKDANFDRIVFEVPAELAFISVQAKRTGLAFADTALCVRLVEISTRAREAQAVWSAQPVVDSKRAFCERYVVRHADEVKVVAPELAAWMRASGWIIADSKRPGHSAPQPHVSVCIPFYNQGEFLDAALTAVANTRYPKLDVCVVNDGSSKTEANDAFAAAARKFPQWKFLSQSNSGPGAARNKAAAAGIGELLLFLDADDLFSPSILSKLVRGLQHSGAAAITCHFRAFEGAFNPDAPPVFEYMPIGCCVEAGALENVFGGSFVLVQRSAFDAVGGFSSQRAAAEDWEFYIKLAAHGFETEVLPQALFFYRTHPKQSTRSLNAFQRHFLSTKAYDALVAPRLMNFFTDIVMPLRAIALGRTLDREFEAKIGLGPRRSSDRVAVLVHELNAMGSRIRELELRNQALNVEIVAKREAAEQVAHLEHLVRERDASLAEMGRLLALAQEQLSSRAVRLARKIVALSHSHEPTKKFFDIVLRRRK